jgi:23S rRNA (cytidine1920-2'-O)/16S rRNA (cytidine1409-2'-O)-methyltransferase
VRLDISLVDRNLVPSRTVAQRLIESGAVQVNGEKIQRPSCLVRDSDVLTLLQTARFVSRGGEKLDFALENWKIDVMGCDALDIGASTGGFTDCLLQRGVGRVFCLDAGKGQLHEKIKADTRVTWREGFNARGLKVEELPFTPNLVVMDVSFISQTLLLPVVMDVLAKGGDVVTLIKPQFELSPEEIGKGGLVREARLHRKAIARVQATAEELGFNWLGLVDSPIQGGDGNREWLCWLRK